MRLLDLLPALTNFKRLRRSEWRDHIYIVRSIDTDVPLVIINHYSLIIKKYNLTLEDLLADDWIESY